LNLLIFHIFKIYVLKYFLSFLNHFSDLPQPTTPKLHDYTPTLTSTDDENENSSNSSEIFTEPVASDEIYFDTIDDNTEASIFQPLTSKHFYNSIF
jgi:hypothetical protein